MAARKRTKSGDVLKDAIVKAAIAFAKADREVDLYTVATEIDHTQEYDGAVWAAYMKDRDLQIAELHEAVDAYKGEK